MHKKGVVQKSKTKGKILEWLTVKPKAEGTTADTNVRTPSSDLQLTQQS